jgi:Ras-related protein Rab-43
LIFDRFHLSVTTQRSAHGVIIVYDITKRNTFISLQKWLNEIRSYTASNVVCALIGNKCDLPEEEREVKRAEAEDVCDVVPEILFYLETSAKENTNVENAFYQIAEELMVIYFSYQQLRDD